MKRISITVLFLFILMRVNAQDLHTAPSLQLGLSGISFSKGTLDAQLIAEIIAEKQSEIRVKLVKSMLLEKIGVTNGLFYAYLDYTIEILTKEKDEQTRIKNLLENTVNISFVVGYTDYYLRTLKKDSEQWNSIKNLALTYGIDKEVFNKKSISLKDIATPLKKHEKDSKIKIDTLNIEDKKRRKSNEFVGVLIDLVAEQIRQNEEFKSLGILRTNYMQQYINMNAYLSLENDENKDSENKELTPETLTKFHDLINNQYADLFNLIDVIKSHHKKNIEYSLTVEDDTLLKKGEEDFTEMQKEVQLDMFRLGKKARKDYQVKLNEDMKVKLSNAGQNNLKGLMDSIGDLSMERSRQENFIAFFDDTKVLLKVYENAFKRKNFADIIYNDVEKNLNVYMKYYGLIKTLSKKGKDWETALHLVVSKSEANTFARMMSYYEAARRDTTIRNLLIKKEAASMQTLNSFISQLNFVKLNSFEFQQTYEKEIAPILNKLSVYSLHFMRLDSTLKSILYTMDLIGTCEAFREINLRTDLAFIDVFTKIDEFDKIETYSAILNQLSDVGDVFSDEEMRKSINLIVGFVRSYIKLSKDTSDKAYINLDVEGFLTSLQKSNYNKFRPLELMFTVGANTTSFQSKYMERNDTLSSYSFIGEKIGFKYKIWDYKYLNSFSKGESFTYKSWWNFIRVNRITYIRNVAPKEPVISDIHILAYGTGLLYNLTNTGTTKGFNSPMLAAGIGITFYNDLDFNISYGKPLVGNVSYFDKRNPSFVNIGFDIQFIEYYNRLNQRRKSNKVQKQLLNAM